MNPFKSHWSFSLAEISFFFATLEHLFKVLSTPGQPAMDELMALRLDCYECHIFIERKLIGISEIKKARLIEHYCRSLHINYVTIREMGVSGKQEKVS